MKDPYQILGISPSATDEEVKEAYRTLARKYHPDNYSADNPLADLATEKMQEVNEAYEAIKNERIWIFYVGARGDASQNDPPRCMIANGMHYNFSVGLATLRRDGFAGMVADGRGELVTRERSPPFHVSALFVESVRTKARQSAAE